MHAPAKRTAGWPRSPDDIAYLTALVRDGDRPRYYATLFAPAALRADLFALYGFAAEIARVPDQVSDPTLGEIRLRWWQDSLADAMAAGARGAPRRSAPSPTQSSRRRLPLAAFEALIEARSADLYSDPPATLADLEGYMGETEFALFQMAAIILGASGPETAEAAGHAGIAYGLARRLAVFASERARGRTILPVDLSRATGACLRPTSSGARRTRSACGQEMSALARRHLDVAQDAVGKLGAPLRVAFLPLAVVPAASETHRAKARYGAPRCEISDFET